MAENNEKLFTRRSILFGSAATGAVVASSIIIGCEGKPGKNGLPGKPGKNAYIEENYTWDQETDVIIVGAGGAGLVAAIEATNAGAAVQVYEKGSLPGGNTSFSGGVLQASQTKYQDQFGIHNDTPEKHYQYWIQAGEGAPDQDLIRLMAYNSKNDIEWIGSLGVNYTKIYAVDPIPYISPDLLLPRLHVADGAGGAYTTLLKQIVQSLGVQILTSSPVNSLVYDSVKGVLGVKAQISGKEASIKAKKAVILACGGYDRNEEMAKAYCPQLYWDIQNGLCLASPNNVGDGIKMGMDIGADLAGMGGTISYPSIRIGRAEGGQPIPGIWVNKYAQRFVNEAAHYGYVSRAIFDQEEHIVWAIFDEKVKQMGGAAIGGWSDDLSAEIASGLIKTAATPGDLASAIGVNNGQLPLTLEKWNNDMADGVDTLFNKQVGLQALDTAPYYATRVLCYNVGSCGGVRINTQAQVLDLQGNAIPGLYAAGMVSGGFIGPYYPGSGTAVTATVVFGRIAGRNAAAEPSKT